MATETSMTATGFGGEDIVRDYIAKYSNWGRWGEEDELGALNHVGPDQITAAARLVRQGKVVSMSLPYDLFGPQVGAFRANPLNLMTATGTDYLNGVQDPLPADWGPAYTFGFALWQEGHLLTRPRRAEIEKLAREATIGADLPNLAEHRDLHFVDGPHRDADGFEVGLDLLLEALA